MRPFTLALLTLIAAAQAELWFGKGSIPHVMDLHAKLQTQQAANAAAQLRNERITAEVTDLKEGLEMVEEKARSDLGMVKPNEILVRVSTAH